MVLAPGAAYGSARRWPSDRFAAVARALKGDGIQPVMIGSAADVPTGHRIEGAIGDVTTVLNLIGQTDLTQLAGVLSLARAIVSNDSGALHLGAALGVPVTAILGPTDERVTGPRASARSEELATVQTLAPRAIVLTNSVWCRPCTLRQCPIDHRCMRRTSIDAVLNAMRRML